MEALVSQRLKSALGPSVLRSALPSAAPGCAKSGIATGTELQSAFVELSDV